jgi:hypothetical protein
MSVDAIMAGLEAAPFAKTIREGSSLFPWIESVHVLAIVIVVGVVAVMDLGLIGVASHSRSVRNLLRDANPYAWGFFGLALVTGFLLFASSATTYIKNPAFLIKFVAMGVAGVNMVVFHAVGVRGVESWDAMAHPPVQARLAGAISLTCWVIVVGAGRWIGFLSN